MSWQKFCPFLGVKVAPGIQYGNLPAQMHARWVSVEGNLVEAALYSPTLLPAGRSAALWRDQQWHILELPGIKYANQNVELLPPTLQLSDYLLEPDPAVIRAGGLAKLAQGTNAQPVADKIAYLTSPHLPSQNWNPYLKTWQIVDHLPLKPKILRAYLHQRQVTRLDLKKRGVDIELTRWRKQVLPKRQPGWEPHPLTLVLTKIGPRAAALVVRPVPNLSTSQPVNQLQNNPSQQG